MSTRSLKRRLIAGFGANTFSRLSTTLTQIFSVPVFLSHWGVHLYGEWILLNTIPSYLGLSDVGFGSVAGNEMTMLAAAEDFEQALVVFQSVWVLTTVITSLLGVLLLTEARREARVRNGQLVPLGEQDRAGWDRALIAEGHDLVRECLAINRPGRYQILAAINAVHTDAPTASDTDWSQVVALYDQLIRLDPSPIVALNRAVAVAELDGPKAALTLVDRLPLTGYHAWHVARADMLRRLGRTPEAKESYDAAIAATQNSAERAYLSRKRGELI